LLWIIFPLCLSNQVIGQEYEFPIYKWEEVQDANPDTILGLNFSKEKRDSLPFDVVKFKNLKYLNISRNRFTSLPDFFGYFEKFGVFYCYKK